MKDRRPSDQDVDPATDRRASMLCCVVPDVLALCAFVVAIFSGMFWTAHAPVIVLARALTAMGALWAAGRIIEEAARRIASGPPVRQEEPGSVRGEFPTVHPQPALVGQAGSTRRGGTV